MVVAQGSSGITVQGKALYRRVEVVELLCKEQSPDQNAIPPTTLVWQGGETFCSDPFQEVDERCTCNALVHSSPKLRYALLLQGHCSLLDESALESIVALVYNLVDGAVIPTRRARAGKAVESTFLPCEGFRGIWRGGKAIDTGERRAHCGRLHCFGRRRLAWLGTCGSGCLCNKRAVFDRCREGRWNSVGIICGIGGGRQSSFGIICGGR
jgi:hypothetical protein